MYYKQSSEIDFFKDGMAHRLFSAASHALALKARKFAGVCLQCQCPVISRDAGIWN